MLVKNSEVFRLINESIQVHRRCFALLDILAHGVHPELDYLEAFAFLSQELQEFSEVTDDQIRDHLVSVGYPAPVRPLEDV